MSDSRNRSRAALMTAALTMAGGVAHAQSRGEVAAEPQARPAETEPVEGEAVQEGSGEAAEEEAAEHCRPGMCPIPLYGVTPIDDWWLEEEGPEAPEGDEATEGRQER